ncbi:MAG: hypothetical protein ABIH91_03715, partial [Candidatus Omnitrophota bacterium]
MINIFKMTEEDILGLDPDEVNDYLGPAEIFQFFTLVNGFWSYNYEAAKAGKVGLHAELKSGWHSDGFLFSKAALRYFNICQIMAQQLVLQWEAKRLPTPDWVVGIPNGATVLGKHVARWMGVKLAEMVKEDGVIKMVSKMPDGESLLFVEDFCTKGTGFKEAVADTLRQNPSVRLLPYELVIVNRGGLKEIEVNGVDSFKIIAAAEHRIKDWNPKVTCPLCNLGSGAIKPKAMDENWQVIMKSQ